MLWFLIATFFGSEARAVRAKPRAGLSPEDDRELRVFIQTLDAIVSQ
jgi:hypothetical protein